jgi:uncharacterized protein (TIGR02147 family)
METQTTPDIQSPYNNLRGLLQKELLNRCKKNTHYSLRAFARSLKLEPSACYKILHGKRNISKKMFAFLALNLKLSPQEQMKILKIDEQCSFKADSEYQKFQTLTIEAFNIISEWYHYAILEMTKLQKFNFEPKTIARSLGLSVSEVNIAIHRLKSLGFLGLNPEGKWTDLSGNITTVGNEFTTIALRKMQVQILNKAIAAMDDIPMECRSQSSITVAIDTSALPKALAEITKFRRKMATLLEDSNLCDQVYNLSISFYPILTNQKNHSKRSKK